ncbi:MAG TPA: 30S ribosomal protein S20 [Pirellulales bacterium]|nr:30S ribosomal protein S20 [Pirellulales bacterium]
MPNTKSAKKRLRQNELRRTRNRAARSALKTLVKKVRGALESGDLSQAQDGFRAVTKKLDQTASRRIIHRNAAARAKSRLSAALKAAKQKQPASA